jgi:transcriptional regulator with XRE-family HTH domain
MRDLKVEMKKESFHIRLRRLRKTRRLTLKELSTLLQVPPTTYREWEYGRAIQGEPYVKLAECLNVTLLELMTGSKPNHQGILNHLEVLERTVSELKKEVLSLL